MKTRPLYVIIGIALLILIVTIYRYQQYVLAENFILEINTICDTSTQLCFDPDTDSSFDDVPYEKVHILDRYAPECLEEHTCQSFSCYGIPGQYCEITYCSDETLTEGESCLINL